MRRGGCAEPDVGRARNVSAPIRRATGTRRDLIAIRIIGCKSDAERLRGRGFEGAAYAFRRSDGAETWPLRLAKLAQGKPLSARSSTAIRRRINMANRM